METDKVRCAWCTKTENMRHYPDTEWGIHAHDERKHFEFIVLVSIQAGLSWQTILNLRAGFRKAFADFVPSEVDQFSNDQVEQLMHDEGLIRNRLKIVRTMKKPEHF